MKKKNWLAIFHGSLIEDKRLLLCCFAAPVPDVPGPVHVSLLPVGVYLSDMALGSSSQSNLNVAFYIDLICCQHQRTLLGRVSLHTRGSNLSARVANGVLF